MDNQLTLRIYQDPDTTSPRENENLGTLACWHRRYTLGDEQPKQDPMEYQDDLPKDSLIVPVYMIDHSGIALSTRDFGDPWDSGQVGIYHVSPEQIVASYGEDTPETRATAQKSIEAEISEYSDYINGNCWGFEILNAEGDHVEGVGGFIGSNPIENGMADHLEDGMLDLLEEAADKAGLSITQAEIKEHLQQRVASRARRSLAP